MVLYHLTNRCNIESIKQYGLQPRVSLNSKLTGETTPYVYLCNAESLPYWFWLLRYDSVLKLTFSRDLQLEEFKYYRYSELLSTEWLYPDEVEEISYVGDAHALTELQEYYIARTSWIVLRYIRASEYGWKEPVDVWLTEACSCVGVCERLHYRDLSAETKVKMLRDYGDDGEYTFLDTYKNTGLRIYEQMSLVDDTSTEYVRKLLYDSIVENFAGCLATDTGGWTG